MRYRAAPKRVMSACWADLRRSLPAPPRKGARRALADVGLDGREAAMDVRDLRALLDCIRFVRRTAVQTSVHLVTTGIILALLGGIAPKLKVFGPGG
jgi:hypothetical protein